MARRRSSFDSSNVLSKILIFLSFVVLFAATLVYYYTVGKSLQEERRPLDEYSLFPAAPFDKITNNWWLSGTAIPTPAKGLVLTPPVTNRYGMLWHRIPVQASAFSATIKLVVDGPERPNFTQGFAVWYVYDTSIQTLARASEKAIKLMNSTGQSESNYQRWLQLHGVPARLQWLRSCLCQPAATQVKGRTKSKGKFICERYGWRW